MDDKRKENAKKMAEVMKANMKKALWIKLKEEQVKEVDRRLKLKEEVAQKIIQKKTLNIDCTKVEDTKRDEPESPFTAA